MSRRLVHFTHTSPDAPRYKTKTCDGRILYSDWAWTVEVHEVTCESCLEVLRLLGEAANRRSKHLSIARRKAAKR